MPAPDQQNISPENLKLAQEAMRKMFGGLPPVNTAVRRLAQPPPEPEKEEVPKTPYLIEPGEVCDGDFWETIRRSTNIESDRIDFIQAEEGFRISAKPDGELTFGIGEDKFVGVYSWKQYSLRLGEILKVCRTTWGDSWGK